MRDFRIINAQILLTITGISPIRGFWPPSILVTGKDFQKAEHVYYNGNEAKDFIIKDNTKIIVKVPDTQVGVELKDLRIISNTPVTNRDASLTLAITGPIKTISGIERLVQCWILLFNTTPGSDIFSPKSGGGAQSVIGGSRGNLSQSASADLSLAVDKTKSEILSLQSRVSGIPANEKLLTTSLDSVSFDPSSSTITGRVTIVNMLGNTGQISIG